MAVVLKMVPEISLQNIWGLSKQDLQKWPLCRKCSLKFLFRVIEIWVKRVYRNGRCVKNVPWNFSSEHLRFELIGFTEMTVVLKKPYMKVLWREQIIWLFDFSSIYSLLKLHLCWKINGHFIFLFKSQTWNVLGMSVVIRQTWNSLKFKSTRSVITICRKMPMIVFLTAVHFNCCTSISVITFDSRVSQILFCVARYIGGWFVYRANHSLTFQV